MTDRRVVIATTPQERADAFAVRLAVFVGEQQIAVEEEIDEHDDTDAVHCIGYADGTPVAAGRLVPMRDGGGDYGKIGRMCVLASHRGSGVGAAVLETLERYGASQGVTLFRLGAQLTAQGFYERAGYTAFGDIFDDAGIPHIMMEKRVTPRRA